MPLESPLKATGGLAILRGNLAPEGAIVKVAGMSNLKFTGPARCFDCEEDAFESVLTFAPDGEATALEQLREDVRDPLAGDVGAAELVLPAVGPGDPVAHGRQRALLGQAAVVRLASLDLGVAGLSIGIPLGAPVLVASGGILAGTALVATAALLVRAVVLGVRASTG